MAPAPKRQKKSGDGVFGGVDVSKLETRLYINGQFVNAKNGRTFPTVDPRTEKVIAQVQEADEADVNLAVAAAKKAFEVGSEWRLMDASKRRNIMLKLAELIIANADELAALETLDNGKPVARDGLKYGSAVDVHLVAECFKYYAGWADKMTGQTIPSDGATMCMTVREPVGVVGQIIPWNFPLLMAAWKLGPALATGCTVVLKTSEKTPLSALLLAKLIDEAGVPAGVVNVLSGYGPSAGAPLAQHPDVDKVAFTGSTPVGQKIMAMAAKNVASVSLELGGKSPVVVMDDADVDQAVDIATTGILLNHGQCCCAGSRVFVQEGIYDEFVKKVAAKFESVQVGDPFDESKTHGPVVDEIQYKKVLGYIETGKKEGARVAAGGGAVDGDGFYIKPTVFADVTDNMTIAREEIFGPVVCALKFKTIEEAIERANDTEFGLAAGIVSRDIGNCLRLARSIRAGTVWTNTYNAFGAGLPFGGFKKSGIGRELGPGGIELYSETKTITIALDKGMDC